MIRRIVIENFMSHKRTVLEPAPGLTVLSGPNNCGKSAVASALRALALNDLRGEFMVRHGESGCRVSVETDDGHLIEWRRRGQAVSYTIDGRVIDRVGSDIPEGLHEALRLPLVTSGDGKDSFDIHFAEQKRPIFLLDQTSRQQALFFASSSDAGLLMEMQRRHRQRTQDGRREAEELERRIAGRNELLKALAPVRALDERLSLCETEGRALDDLTKMVTSLGTDLATLSATTTAALTAEGRLRVLEGLERPPNLLDTVPLDNLVSTLERAARDESFCRERAEALRPLSAPPAVVDPRPLEDLCSELSLARTAVEVETRRAVALSKLPLALTLEPVEPLEALLVELQRATGGAARAQAVARYLAPLAPPPEVANTSALEAAITDLKLASAGHREASRGASSAAAEASRAQAEVLRWAAQNPTCPTCGADINPERLLKIRSVEAHERT